MRETIMDEAWSVIMAIYNERDMRDGAYPGPDITAARTDIRPEEVATQVRRARRLHRMYERLCSENLGFSEQARVEAQAAEVEKRIAAFFAAIDPAAGGYMVRFNLDPRGYPARLVLPRSKAGNTLGAREEHGFGLA